MTAVASTLDSTLSTYHGLRMSAKEYLELTPDGHDYELIDGIVIMSPSPTPRHQHVSGLIYHQLAEYLDRNPVGMVFMECDVNFGEGPTGQGLVYRPELVFVRREHLSDVGDWIEGPPALAVEVISPSSRRLDTETKRADYARAGVLEYWVIDPARSVMAFLRLEGGSYVEVSPQGDRFLSQAVQGFELDLAKVRKSFKSW